MQKENAYQKVLDDAKRWEKKNGSCTKKRKVASEEGIFIVITCDGT